MCVLHIIKAWPMVNPYTQFMILIITTTSRTAAAIAVSVAVVMIIIITHSSIHINKFCYLTTFKQAENETSLVDYDYVYLTSLASITNV